MNSCPLTLQIWKLFCFSLLAVLWFSISAILLSQTSKVFKVAKVAKNANLLYNCFETRSENHNHISFADNARNLGVYFDCTFSMEHHVKQLCKSLFFELRKISHMRAFLNEASLQKLITSFVLSRMDYCNSLLVNLPNDTITKLQRIQNHAARLVLKKTKRDHVTSLFRKLHWLPLQARIDYKICVLCFKCINKTAPSYLSDLLEQYVPSRLLRSGSQNLLKIPPRANKKCTEKAFKHCAPYIWNSLPSDIREAKSESQFKNYLKTHLFKSHLCI